MCFKNGRKTKHQWLTPVILNYSGGTDQEDHSLKPVQANSSQDPISKKKKKKTQHKTKGW
jgi:hypothetical protein